MIGETEGQGFKQIMAGLELGRINVAARGVGVAQAALDEAVRYSQQRYTFGKPICQHQAIQLKLADIVPVDLGQRGEFAATLVAAGLLPGQAVAGRKGD